MADTPQILIVSDLHLSRGLYTEGDRAGRFSNLEDFFADQEFFNMLAGHAAQGGKWRLILNGDVVDFLQVIDFPADSDMLEALKQTLQEGQDWDRWAAKQREYGLGTTAIETCWKLAQIVAGHPIFFLALGYWLALGHEVIVVRGNHDVEWHWPQVQDALRRLIAQSYKPDQIERLASKFAAPRDSRITGPIPIPVALSAQALQRLQFCSRFYYVPGLLYVEHGCQYEVSNSFPDLIDPVLPQERRLPPTQQRIELPIGSFFVRYFFNRVEQDAPFADNVRPLVRYLNWVLAHRKRWAVNLLLTRWDLFREIGGRLRKIRLENQAAGALPAARRATVTMPTDCWHGPTPLPDVTGFIEALQDLEQRVFQSCPPLLYLDVGQWPAAVRHYRSDVLQQAASEIHRLLAQHDRAVRFVVLGHDHDADMRPLDTEGRTWYVNAGTWTPIAGEQERLFRDTRELTYIKIVPGSDGGEPQAHLLRWDDGAAQGKPVILMSDAPRRNPSSKTAWWLAAALVGGLIFWLVRRRGRVTRRGSSLALRER